MICLGADGGKNHFSVAIIDVTDTTITPIYSTMIKNTVMHLKDGTEKDKRSKLKHAQSLSFSLSMPLYQKEISKLLTKYKPQIVCAERYQAGRGASGSGTNVEIISSMNYGLMLAAHNRKASPLLITASQWKNCWNRNEELDLKEFMYKEWAKILCKKNFNHPLDSALIAIYGAQKSYPQIQTKEAVIAFMKHLANVIDTTER